MRERPAGSELLAIAERTLREQLLPKLRDEQRHLVLMVLKALSIAERQLTLDESPFDVERAQLEALLGGEGASAAELERELASRVRRGACDDDHAAQRVLWDLTLRRVRESAPRLLESEGLL